MAEPARDLTRVLLGVLVIGALSVAAFWIVRPFLAATIWATMIVVVTWPVMLRMQARLWKSRGLAITVMMVILLLLFVVPLTLAVGTIVANAREIADGVRSIASYRLPVSPAWVTDLPFVGERLATAWEDAAAAGLEGLWAHVVPYAGSVTAWFVAEAGSIGYLMVQFLLTLVLAGFMYGHGEAAAAAVVRLGHRLGGSHGADLVHLAGQAIRAVALGVGLTAVIQSVLGGIGLAAAGVPFAGVLTALLFMLCVSQIGMLVVLIPAVIWVYWSGHPVWGTFLLVWSLVASLLDNFLRPMLVRRSADLPILVIFAGVIGGLLAFGLVGIFVGPVVLAVAYTLLLTWMDQGASPAKTK
ncbi:MAG TPA: AI-2E family transporter YdiK [Caldimonas sp.]